jgi:hypothetical protein
VAKEKYTKERPPCIFLIPALLINQRACATRFAQTMLGFIAD